jgi:hypothetical protein
MFGRIKALGIILAVLGLVFVVAGGYAFMKTQDGAKSLQAFSSAQDIKLSYNDQGQLVDRGDTAEAAAILSLLKNDWAYPVVDSELNAKDPLVNTPTEYMYQMATIAYHTLHSTQTVVLPEDVTTADGTVYKAGSYDFPVDGRYWTAFDRTNPIEAKAREQAWTGTAHALIGELGVGTLTATNLQMGLALAGLFAGIGFMQIVTGLGLVWAARPEKAPVPKLVTKPIPA